MLRFTIGHSTRPIDEFIKLLQEHTVAELIDIRRFPGSKRYPQFNAPNLQRALDEAGMGYTHYERLGGRRAPRPDSKNLGWGNDGFRGYADYLASMPAREALAELDLTSSEKRVAIMCAEAVPWHCHRNLIADWFVARGRNVVHILSAGRARPHKLNEMAVTQVDGTITYPAQQRELFVN